jgi:beta-xylosidase
MSSIRPSFLVRVIVGAAAFATCALAQITPSFTRNATVHDPAVIRSGGVYYVFGSHLASASSTDLMNWTQISTSVSNSNPLIPNVFTELSETFAWAQSNTLWAPDVFRLQDGRFALRSCVVNFRTEAEDMEAVLEVAAELGAVIDQRLRPEGLR